MDALQARSRAGARASASEHVGAAPSLALVPSSGISTPAHVRKRRRRYETLRADARRYRARRRRAERRAAGGAGRRAIGGGGGARRRRSPSRALAPVPESDEGTAAAAAAAEEAPESRVLHPGGPRPLRAGEEAAEAGAMPTATELFELEEDSFSDLMA